MHDYDELHDEAVYRSQMTPPRNGTQLSLLYGLGGGLLATIIPILLTLLNAPVYQEAARLGSNMPYNTALMLFWLGAIYYVLELLISFFVGFFVGKKAVKRLLGFYAGLFVGAISYLGNFLVHYLPGYPDKLGFTPPTSGNAIVGALFYSLAIFIVRALITGLIGLWGSWSSTRKHPYYQRSEA